jgi:hypothetical protein
LVIHIDATKMKKTILMAAAAAMTLAMTQDDKTKKEIVGLTPKQVEWFTLPTTRMGVSVRSCSAIPAMAARGWIE